MSDISIPNAFWKYYDLYRRKKITIDAFQQFSGIGKDELLAYLKEVEVKTDDDFLPLMRYNTNKWG